MTDVEEHKIRWSPFKLFFTLLLTVAGCIDIYFALIPIFEQDYELKSFANILFALVVIFFMFAVVKVRKNYEWVFWACAFGLVIFCSVLFVQHDQIFT